MKEIIIDGVNVAECKELANYEYVLFVCHETGKKCELNQNCYYKQLKRLEQENEKLEKEKEKYYQQTLDDEIQMNELMQDNELLKKRVEILQVSFRDTGLMYEKYKNALQEIKAIIKDCDNGKCFSCKYNEEDAENCVDCKHNEILGLITKAEVGE